MTTPTIVINFGKKLRDWDGFGINYVETAQTRDYESYPQDYGGFSYLNETQRQEILDLTFGETGLKPGLAKMFLDPFHMPQETPNNNYRFDPNYLDPACYDHNRTTSWMRAFIKHGYNITRTRGQDMEIIVTLYGPPAWMTRQKLVRGRDLNPLYKTEVAKYMIVWAKHLREVEGLPVKYLSLHNEGEDWPRWPLDGSNGGTLDHDHNMYWPPEQVVDFLKFMPSMLSAYGLDDVGVTPGETSNWYRFHSWGYADAIADDPEAVQGIGLITSHGFFGRDPEGDWFGDWRSAGIDTIREKKPELHAWVTSTSWSNMDVFFVNEIRNNIYGAKVNGIIPWATIQLHGHWNGGDPNPGTAFKVWEDGRYEVTKGYYFFKQVCRAGQRGMSVCKTYGNDRRLGTIAFGANNTRNHDAFVVLNMHSEAKTFSLTVKGGSSQRYQAFCTSPEHTYAECGIFDLVGDTLTVDLPPLSVTTYYAV